MRRLCTAALLALTPAAALADGGMPQMDFQNVLTTSQVVWMVVIMVVLYIALAGWGLPGMGKVLESRAAVIARDLAAANAAKAEADRAVAAMKLQMNQARAAAQSQIAAAAEAAKAQAAADAAALAETLETKLAAAEAQIERAREAALAAIKPVAAATAAVILQRVTGAAPEPAGLDAAVDTAFAAKAA